MRKEFLKTREIPETGFKTKKIEKEVKKLSFAESFNNLWVKRRIHWIIPEKQSIYKIEWKMFSLKVNDLLNPKYNLKVTSKSSYYPEKVANFIENIYAVKFPLNEENIVLNKNAKIQNSAFYIKWIQEELSKKYSFSQIEINDVYEDNWRVLVDWFFKKNWSEKISTKVFVQSNNNSLKVA